VRSSSVPAGVVIASLIAVLYVAIGLWAGVGQSWDSNFYLLFSQDLRLNGRIDFGQGLYAPLYASSRQPYYFGPELRACAVRCERWIRWGHFPRRLRCPADRLSIPNEAGPWLSRHCRCYRIAHLSVRLDRAAVRSASYVGVRRGPPSRPEWQGFRGSARSAWIAAADSLCWFIRVSGDHRLLGL